MFRQDLRRWISQRSDRRPRLGSGEASAFVLLLPGECTSPIALGSIPLFIVTALAVLIAVRRRFDIQRHFLIRSGVLLRGFVLVRRDTWLEFPLSCRPGVDRQATRIRAA